MPEWPTLPAGAGYPLVDADTGEFLSDAVKDWLEDFLGGGGSGDGRVIHTGPLNLAGVQATLDAAEAAGPYTVAFFPPGVYNVGAGLSMSGRTALIQGAGSGGYDGGWTGTTFYAGSQAGPVIDFTGYLVPTDQAGEVFTNRIDIGGFAVVGSGVGDASKVKAGVKLTSMSSAYFHDITVRETGGPGWVHASSPGDAVYLCDFERITVSSPVSAQTNDVPYFDLNESNGCRFRSLGIRSTKTANDCGVSGAVRVRSNGTYTGYDILFDGFWAEYLHIPSGGCVINIESNKTHFRDTGWHDIYKVSGATNTAYFRLNAPAVTNHGGNTISGFIPGFVGGATDVDWGVDVLQSRNRITGVKGFSGNNVRLASGVEFTFVELGGGESGTTGVAVQNNSGTDNNVIRDNYQRLYQEGTYLQRPRGAGEGGAGPEFKDAATPANGAIWLGNADARMQSVGASLYFTGAELHLRKPDFTPAPIYLQGGSGGLGIITHTGDPNGSGFYMSPGSLCLCTDGTMWRKATGVGTNTGWVSLS